MQALVAQPAVRRVAQQAGGGIEPVERQAAELALRAQHTLADSELLPADQGAGRRRGGRCGGGGLGRAGKGLHADLARCELPAAIGPAEGGGLLVAQQERLGGGCVVQPHRQGIDHQLPALCRQRAGVRAGMHQGIELVVAQLAVGHQLGAVQVACQGEVGGRCPQGGLIGCRVYRELAAAQTGLQRGACWREPATLPVEGQLGFAAQFQCGGQGLAHAGQGAQPGCQLRQIARLELELPLALCVRQVALRAGLPAGCLGLELAAGAPG